MNPMFKHILFLTLISLLLLGCKKQVQTVTLDTKKPEMSIKVKHKKSAELSELSKKEIGNWKEYNELNDFFERYTNVSPNEALDMSIELQKLTENLKDSIRYDDLKTNAVVSRTNVLENEVLRLVDMALIPAIKADEVNSQIDKVFLVFNSFNQKVNTVYSKKKFDKELNLDDFFDLDKEKVSGSGK